MLFTDLPTEILHQILHYVPPHTFLAVSQTSTTLRAVTDTPLLWRHFCRTEYKYWDPRHGFAASLARPVDDIAWKQWYAARRVLDRHVDVLMDDIVNTARGRIAKMEMIVNIDTATLQGNRDLWDVKDALLRHVNRGGDDKAEDGLARQFWAQATLDKLHRGRALNLWLAIKDDSQAASLEQVLAAFDMFVEGLEDAECKDVSVLLDAVADTFRRENPHHEERSCRQRAVNLALFLREHGYRGAQDVFYHNLPNNFIGRALRDPEHPALPIICVAIYCAVARRLGINAEPCGFPMHVYAVVEAPPGQNLDGGLRATSESSSDRHHPLRRMYIDAFRPGVEVPLSDLTAQLSSIGAGGPAAATFLDAASATEITSRTSRNIMHSVRMVKQRPSQHGVYTDTEGWPDTEASLYAALWVSILLREEQSGALASLREERARMRHHLPFLCELFQAYYPWDVSAFEELVLPQLLGFPEYVQLQQIVRGVRRGDEDARPQVRRVGNDRARNVIYKVGQVFSHRRLRYQGVIIGWDVRCDASREWMEQMGVERLDRGSEQSFYHVLAEDKSNRYVAEDNIVLTTEGPSPALMKLAGRFFRRYDAQTGTFVSNIREEYPDD